MADPPLVFGEILSFTGFAIMVWNLGAVFVLAMTAGNPIPERSTHTNGSTKTSMTTQRRKAVIPGYSETGIRNHRSAVSTTDESGLVLNSRADRPLLNGYWLHGLRANCKAS